MHILYETISNPRGRVRRSGEECAVLCRSVVYTDRVTPRTGGLLGLLRLPVVVLIPIYAHRDRLRAGPVRNDNSAL